MFETVQNIIAEELGIDKNTITMDSRLTEDLGADSLDAVNLIMKLEDDYNISIADEVMSTFEKVSDVVEYLEKVLK